MLSGYRNTSSINSLLEWLDWPTLERCRQISRLSRLHRTHSGLVRRLSLRAKPPSPPKGCSNSSQQERSTGALPFYSAQSRTGTTGPRKQLTFLCQGPPPYKPSVRTHTPHTTPSHSPGLQLPCCWHSGHTMELYSYFVHHFHRRSSLWWTELVSVDIQFQANTIQFQCEPRTPQLLKREESRSGFRPRSLCLPA